MKQKWLRRWHRRIALVWAPFLLLQAFSGVFLSFALYCRLAGLPEQPAPSPDEGAWIQFMVRLHHGGGGLATAYHTLLFLGAVWITFTGALIWINRLRRLLRWRNSQRPTPNR